MSAYAAPLKDMKFVLHELPVGLPEAFGRRHCAVIPL